MQLFEATGWHLHEPNETSALTATATPDEHLLHASSVVTSPYVTNTPYRLGAANTGAGSRREGFIEETKPLGLAIIKHYAFSSHKQRMAVLAAVGPAPLEGSSGRPSPLLCAEDKCIVYAYVKGAPERLRPLCDPETVPDDFAAILQQYTRDGLRVLAVAGRRLQVDSWTAACDLPRGEVESNLCFLGLVIFQNKVKAATRPALAELHRARIRTLMITGDNMLTACSVARECGMVGEDASVVQALAWDHTTDGDLPASQGATAGNGGRHGPHYSVDTRSWSDDENGHGLGHGSKSKRSRPRRRARGWQYEAVPSPHDASRPPSTDGGVSDTSETTVDSVSLGGSNGNGNGLYEAPPPWQLVLAPVDALDTAVSAEHQPHGVALMRYPKLKHDVAPQQWIPPARGSVVVAVTGKEFGRIRTQLPEDYRRLIVGGTIFARMAPDQKAQLVEDLIDLGFTTAMCGDGANDCSALKAAHVGISLSETEASVAAPFTSAIPNISCVPALIREGRAALVTSFACFKFMALYSFTEFTTVLITYFINSNLGDFQFLYIDLILILVLAVLMSRTGAYWRLDPQRPPGRLVAFSILLSLLCQIVLHVVTQAVALELVKLQRWFVPLEPDPNGTNIKCYETTTVFLVSIFQYIAVALAFSAGPPYRAPLLRNVPFLVAAGLLFALNVSFVVYPPLFMARLLQLQPLPDYRFRLLLLGVAVINMVLSIALEQYLRTPGAQRLLSRMQGKRHYRNAYKNVARALVLDRWAYRAFCPGLDLSKHGDKPKTGKNKKGKSDKGKLGAGAAAGGTVDLGLAGGDVALSGGRGGPTPNGQSAAATQA